MVQIQQDSSIHITVQFGRLNYIVQIEHYIEQDSSVQITVQFSRLNYIVQIELSSLPNYIVV